MARRNRNTLTISDVRTQKQLRQLRRELDMQMWYAGEKLAGDASAIFSLSNLLSLVIPSTSKAGSVVKGIGTGISAVKWVMGALSSLGGKR